MKAKTNLTAAAIISALLGVLFGAFIKGLPSHFALSDIIGIIFTVLGVFTLFSSIPEFFIAASRLSTLGGKFSLISATLGTLSGLILIFYHSSIIIPIIAVYLIILPLFRIIFAHPKEQRSICVKALFPKIVLGVLLIVFFPVASGIADKVFALILACIGWGIIALSLIALLLFLFVLHVVPHIIKKKYSKNDNTIYLDDEDFNDKNN